MRPVVTYVFRVCGAVFFYVFSCASYGRVELPIIDVVSAVPLLFSVSEKGETFAVSPSKKFMRDIFEMYEDVYVEDLTGDGVAEVFFRLGSRGVNTCYKVLTYMGRDRSLGELLFSGGELCNYRVENGRVISAYKNGAVWVEDVYFFRDGKFFIELSDSCVGCGEVTRRAYRHDSSFFSFLVSDDMNFEGRVPFVAEVKSQRAWIFSSPEAAGPTDRYLKVGDKVTFLNVESVRGQEWVEFRFSEDSSPEGWLKCSDVGGCDFG